MAQTIPSLGIKALLDAADPSIVGGSSGWDCKIGRLAAQNDKCVAIIDTGGRSPEVKVAINYPSVQVLVRGSPNDYAASRTKAEAIKSLLLAYPVPTPLYSELSSLTMQGDIAWLGYDTEKDRPLWSLNFSLITFNEVDGHRDW